MNFQELFNAAMMQISRIGNIKFKETDTEADKLAALKALPSFEEQMSLNAISLKEMNDIIVGMSNQIEGIKAEIAAEKINASIKAELQGIEAKLVSDLDLKLKASEDKLFAEFADAKLAVLNAGNVIAGDTDSTGSSDSGKEVKMVKRIFAGKEIEVPMVSK